MTAGTIAAAASPCAAARSAVGGRGTLPSRSARQAWPSWSNSAPRRARQPRTTCWRRPEHRRQQPIGLADLGDIGPPGGVEGRRREDQDRGVDEQSASSARPCCRSSHGAPRRACPPRPGRSGGSARSSCADRDYAASPSHRGCRSRYRASPDWSRSASRARQPADDRRDAGLRDRQLIGEAPRDHDQQRRR